MAFYSKSILKCVKSCLLCIELFAILSFTLSTSVRFRNKTEFPKQPTETRLDETGRDWRPFPNGRDRDGTTSLWSRRSGKFGKNSGKIRDGTGLLGTTREKSWMVLKWTEIQEFSRNSVLNNPNFPEFSNSGIPVSFSGLRRDGSWPVPNGGTETGPGRGCSRMLGTGKSPNFPGKNSVPKKRDRERRPLGCGETGARTHIILNLSKGWLWFCSFRYHCSQLCV